MCWQRVHAEWGKICLQVLEFTIERVPRVKAPARTLERDVQEKLLSQDVGGYSFDNGVSLPPKSLELVQVSPGNPPVPVLRKSVMVKAYVEGSFYPNTCGAYRKFAEAEKEVLSSLPKGSRAMLTIKRDIGGHPIPYYHIGFARKVANFLLQ